MELLISLYDNFLIYYPNIFFPFFFLAGSLGVFFVIKAVTHPLIQEIFINLRKTGRAFSRIQYSKMYAGKSRFFYLAVHMCIFLIKNVLGAILYLEVKIEKILKRIGREILIEG